MRQDLERFADFATRHGENPAVTGTPDSDYGYRLTASRDVLAAFVAERVALKRPARFPDTGLPEGSAALRRWSEVGRAMLGDVSEKDPQA